MGGFQHLSLSPETEMNTLGNSREGCGRGRGGGGGGGEWTEMRGEGIWSLYKESKLLLWLQAQACTFLVI